MMLQTHQRAARLGRIWLCLGPLALVLLHGLGVGCGSNRPRFAPPEDEPEPPEGEEWFCFHATTLHHVSVCKREVQRCEKTRKLFAASDEEMREYITPTAPPPQPAPPPPPQPPPTPEDDNEVSDQGDTQPEPDQLIGICSIDPGACPMVIERRFSKPAYSACGSKTTAVCSAYYHEFNYWRPNEETHWKYFCAENMTDCESWRELSHLHLAKRPCVTVR